MGAKIYNTLSSKEINSAERLCTSGMVFDTDFNRWRIDTGEKPAFSNCVECKRRANVEAKMSVTSHPSGETVEVYPVRCRSYKCRHVFFAEGLPPQFDQELVPKRQKEPVNV